MANDEVLGPRKTMFVLVIVVGCFAVLWPRILSPLILGHSAEHLKPNKFDREAVLKQERPPIRIGPHPALLERGRAIPPGPPPPSRPVVLPPHIRVRPSPLSVYYELDIKPPPIPGMRPPLGSPGGPVPAPKSSMGFVMPIYTICIIVFFVYTLSKILFKRTGAPYDPVTPDPQFRRRVFRDDSRSSPDKLVVSAISGLVAEVQQQMQAGFAQSQQRQEVLDNARPYTNGTIIHSGPVQIVASEYKEKTPEPQKQKELSSETIEELPEPVDITSEANKVFQLINDLNQEHDEEEASPIPTESTIETENISATTQKSNEEILQSNEEVEHIVNDLKEPEKENILLDLEDKDVPITKEKIIEAEEKVNAELDVPRPEVEHVTNHENTEFDLIKLSEEENLEKVDPLTQLTEDFLKEEINVAEEEKVSTEELLEEAIMDLPEEASVEDDKENQSVKVVGMEITEHAADGSSYRPEPPKVTPQPITHEAEEVKSIFLETEIPQQSRVLVADFAEDVPPRQETRKHTPLVVSGKITLSLIQDAPRDTPDRDLESTMDEFTTASAFTQAAAEKEDDLDASEEEIEEEIEVEEIEEIEEEEEEEEEPKKDAQKEK